ncbi:MAG TPA: DUF3891 family protein [Stellaceae bacterium]
MIVRNEDGQTILIAQTDHSRLVGQFAAHWGNGDFATPRPYEPVARAAAFHDYGWLRYETAPLYDAVSGETPEFRKAPNDGRQLDGYQWCVDWLLADDPYAGLIVNMHRTGLWRGRYGAIAHPGFGAARGLPAPVEEFIAKNEARQERERATVDADEVWTNYRLLQVWDLLGLYFCCQEPYRDYIEPVPTSYGGGRGDGVRLTLDPVGPGTVAFDPYPLDIRPLTIQFTRRRLTRGPFADQAAFRRAYFQARLELVEFELV